MSALTGARPRRTTGFPDPRDSRRSASSTGHEYGFDGPRACSHRECETVTGAGSPAGSTDLSTWNHRRDEFGRIVSPRLPRLRRLALKMMRSEELADDAVQEALVGLWREERLPRNLDGWLVRAVVHRCLHLCRTRERRRRHEQRASFRRNEYDPSWDSSRPLESAEVVQAVEAALGRLPDHLRTVFVLREGEEMEYAAIAEALSVPVGTVRSRLSRAREALKDDLLVLTLIE